jgi:drug/metabolite transporter (DMT)-like permease
LAAFSKHTDITARFACLFAGAIWGLFWIPLRAIADTGMHSLWTPLVWFGIPTCCLVPVIIWRWRQIMAGGLSLQITAMTAGLALTCYTFSFIYTEVVRAMLLYYLTPVWSTILARLILGDAITGLRVLAMSLALMGMLIIFGLGMNFPIPRNMGDWLGLASGVIWAVAAVRLRQSDRYSTIDLTCVYFVWCMLASLAACLILMPDAMPSAAQITPLLYWILPIIVLLVIPGAFASLWGPKFLNPGLVGLLFMTEIIFGSISAALFAGEPFGSREISGILLIASASLLEPVSDILRARRAANRLS